VPHEATFSRAFDEFARMELPQFVHEASHSRDQQDRLIGHIARDSTAIEARERFPETPAQAAARKSGAEGRPSRRSPRRQERSSRSRSAFSPAASAPTCPGGHAPETPADHETAGNAGRSAGSM